MITSVMLLDFGKFNFISCLNFRLLSTVSPRSLSASLEALKLPAITRTVFSVLFFSACTTLNFTLLSTILFSWESFTYIFYNYNSHRLLPSFAHLSLKRGDYPEKFHCFVLSYKRKAFVLDVLIKPVVYEPFIFCTVFTGCTPDKAHRLGNQHVTHETSVDSH